jgi:radical SAM superfamily enzyme YgiQ (UPF0313 family)
MPSRILLISANRCTAPDPVFPLGLACLNAALRRAGHETLWFDRLFENGSLEEALSRFRPNYACISLRNIDDVVIRKRETYFGEMVSMGEVLRSRGRCPVIVGGSGFSIFPERLLELSAADFGICGEGEAGLVALVGSLETGADWSQIPGLVFKRDGRVRVNPPAPRAIGASGSAGFAEADRPAAVREHYLRTSGTLNLQTQRGCSFRCCYCTYPLIEGSRHLRRPAEEIAEEFALLERQGARYVFIVDSIFNSSMRHVEEVCSALERRGNKLPWGAFFRPQGLTPELIRLMKRAGLAHMEFGADSFSDTVLAAYEKGFQFEEILRSSEMARQEGVEYCHFLICGGPGETAETMQESFVNSRRLNNAVIMAVVGMRIYPGTSLFERAVREGRIARDADLLEPTYYVAPGLEVESTFAQLQEFARLAPNWVVGDTPPAYRQLVERLRQRGIIGPLWSYFAMMQRLWPMGVAGRAAG